MLQQLELVAAIQECACHTPHTSCPGHSQCLHNCPPCWPQKWFDHGMFKRAYSILQHLECGAPTARQSANANIDTCELRDNSNTFGQQKQKPIQLVGIPLEESRQSNSRLHHSHANLISYCPYFGIMLLTSLGMRSRPIACFGSYFPPSWQLKSSSYRTCIILPHSRVA
jgi:hypothetical protein